MVHKGAQPPLVTGAPHTVTGTYKADHLQMLQASLTLSSMENRGGRL